MKTIILSLVLLLTMSACSKKDADMDDYPWLMEKVNAFSNNCSTPTAVYKGTLDGKKAFRIQGYCCPTCNCMAPIYWADGTLVEGSQNNGWHSQNSNPQLVYQCGEDPDE